MCRRRYCVHASILREMKSIIAICLFCAALPCAQTYAQGPEAENGAQRKVFEGEDVPVGELLKALAHLAKINYVAPDLDKPLNYDGKEIPNPLSKDTISFSFGGMDPLKAFHFVARNKGYTVHERDGITYLSHPQLAAFDVLSTRNYEIKNIDARWMLEPVASLLGMTLANPGGQSGYGGYAGMPSSTPAYPVSQEEGRNSGNGNSSNSNSTSGSSSDASSDYTTFTTGKLNARFTPALPMSQPIYVGGFNGSSSIFVNRATNSLIIRAGDEEHRQVEEFLAKNDVPEAQIQIDIKFVEIALTDNVKDGIDWSDTLGNATFKMTPISPDPASFAGMALSNIWNLDPNAVIMSYPTAQATLRFLQTQKNAVLSSAPRIVTKSGVPAAIEATVLESIEVYTIVNTTGVSQPVTSGTEQFATGVFMDVIATLTPSGNIQMNMNPTVSNKVGESVGSSGQVLPIISKRKATTSVTIAPSQTVVIGGLIQGGSEGDDTKVPILGDIPVLGHLFKSSSTETQKTSLLIFVTATLVPPSSLKTMGEYERKVYEADKKILDTADYKAERERVVGVVEKYREYMRKEPKTVKIKLPRIEQ